MFSGTDDGFIARTVTQGGWIRPENSRPGKDQLIEEVEAEPVSKAEGGGELVLASHLGDRRIGGVADKMLIAGAADDRPSRRQGEARLRLDANALQAAVRGELGETGRGGLGGGDAEISIEIVRVGEVKPRAGAHR